MLGRVGFILVMLLLCLDASYIDFTKNNKKVLLGSEILVCNPNYTYSDVVDATFQKSDVAHINMGFVKDEVIWVRTRLYNSSNVKVSKILEFINPLLESVIVYDGKKILKGGMAHISDEQRHLNPSFEINMLPKEYKTLYIRVKNITTSLRFGLHLKDKESFLYDENRQHTLICIFFTVLWMLLLYNMTLYIYTKKNLYIFYCLYLFALMSQQSTYLGFTQMYFPKWFIYYDNLAVLFKVNILYISAAIFAKSFLQTTNYPKIDRVYNVIIAIALIEIPVFGTPWFYYPEVGIVTALFFIIFNLFAGYYIYINGYKQARFFIIGWSFLIVGFVLMILDGLGIITIMHKTSSMILFFTAFEAVILSLAFLDRYMILKGEKEYADTMLVHAMRDRQKSIETEIKKKTDTINKALESKKILLRELHHRTKNNLQLILSLIRMQSDGLKGDVKIKFKDLEGRISAIAKSHQFLYLKDDLQKINMDEYIDELCNDLESLTDKDLTINIDARDIYIPLREASYIGIIINELITNSIKYVELSKIVICVEMFRDNDTYTLEVKDNGSGFDYNSQIDGVGLKLVKTLVKLQLNGELYVNMKNGCRYTIKYRL